MKKVFFAAMLLCAGVVSCSTDDLASTSISEKKTDGIQLVLSVDQFTKVNTSRAKVTEALVQDVTILQFKGGKVVKTKYIENPVTSSPIDLGTDWESMDRATTKEKTNQYGKETAYVDEDVNDMNCIVALANIGSDMTSEWSGKNYQEWFKSLSTEFDAENAEVLPMIGRYTAGLQKGVTNQVDITLYRTVAKVNYTVNTDNFSINGTKPSAISVRSVTLCNVPKNITYYDAYRYNRPALPDNGEPGLWPETQSPYPTYNKDNWQEELPMENQSKTTNNWVFYMPSNVRGSYDGITSNADKYPSQLKNLDSNNLNQDEASFTYLKVIVDYTTKSGAAKSATYKVYLGGDSKGDMNILNNTQYTVTTNLYGANTADTRITANDTNFDPTDINDNMPAGVLGMANCYMIDMNAASSAKTVKTLSRAGETTGTLNKTGEITIPLAQVRNGWLLIDRYDNAVKGADQTDHVSDIEKIIKNGEYEFKLIWTTQKENGTFSGQAASFAQDGNNSDFSSKGNFYGKLSFKGFSNGNSALVGIYYKPKTEETQEENDDATITAFESGDLLWSWHIWFTDYDPDKVNESYCGVGFTQTNGAFYGKKMMSLNLGASMQGITQTPLSQPSSDGQKYWGFYYQYGRKDPQGMAESSSKFVTKYNAAGKEYPDTITSASDGVTLAKANMTPGQFFSKGTGGTGDWSVPGVNGTNNDYWNGANMNKIKSPFDPCPAGWRVPMSSNNASTNPWAGFGDDQKNSVASGNNQDYFVWKENSQNANNTGRLYIDSQDSNHTAWYPASGCRGVASGASAGVGYNGYYWSASAGSNTLARYLYFLSTLVNPQNYSYRAYGFPVRCVQE